MYQQDCIRYVHYCVLLCEILLIIYLIVALFINCFINGRINLSQSPGVPEQQYSTMKQMSIGPLKSISFHCWVISASCNTCAVLILVQLSLNKEIKRFHLVCTRFYLMLWTWFGSICKCHFCCWCNKQSQTCTVIFPNHLKITVVKPLYKKGFKTIMKICRTISLGMIFSKVFEKAVHSTLSHHLRTNNSS